MSALFILVNIALLIIFIKYRDNVVIQAIKITAIVLLLFVVYDMSSKVIDVQNQISDTQTSLCYVSQHTDELQAEEFCK